MFKKKLFAMAGVVGAMALAGCTPELAKTQLTSAPMAELAPTKQQLAEQLKGQGSKIIVAPVEYSTPNGKFFVTEVYDDLTQRVMKSGNTVVDRELALKLKDELIAAEKSGKFRTSGPSVADVALMSKIVNLNSSKSFHKARSWVDDKGERHRVEAYCSFSAKAKMYVRAYTMPSMELINTYEYEGSENFSSETTNSRCPISDTQLRSLYSETLADAVKSGSFQTLNDLAPEAYVIERRDEIGKPGESALFRITISKKQGAVEGATVNFYHKEKQITPITNETRIQQVLIGEGEVTKDVDTTGAYVYVSDEEVINKIKIGDVAKLSHGKCDVTETEVLGSCIKIPGL
ncbi:hypothetical protein [Marinomonas pollencensis]|uniref:Lipoprotein n=1 Tax=Marinomonas pollencensis TaxID=491954 RepID=A0A3E0DS35_9GAMM|nr:hypothetical protein [Marinomonas pollencensis]REG85888.1 hypothetical protein DFP81_102427 [Marinomonas pollencensis]